LRVAAAISAGCGDPCSVPKVGSEFVQPQLGEMHGSNRRPRRAPGRAIIDTAMSVTVLDREIFSEAEAARLLRVAQGTLHYWLNGGQRRGRTYPPVIRTEPRDGRVVTWAEFVEAGLLSGYRRGLQGPNLGGGPF